MLLQWGDSVERMSKLNGPGKSDKRSSQHTSYILLQTADSARRVVGMPSYRRVYRQLSPVEGFKRTTENGIVVSVVSWTPFEAWVWESR
jgi:hypothetical protein